MDMFALFLLVVFLGARMNTTYHPHLLVKKYVVIKNKTAARLLIDQSDLVNSRIKNAAANRNKLLCAGIVFYGLFLLLAVFSAVLFWMPEIPAEGFAVDSRFLFLTGDTLNAKLPVILGFVLLFAEMAFYFINTAGYAAEKAAAKWLVRVSYSILAAVCLLGMLCGLWSVIVAVMGVR